MQFLRSNTSGIKYVSPNGKRDGLLPVSTLSTLPAFAAVPVQCETCETINPAATMHPHSTGLQCHACKTPAPRASAALVNELKEQGQDFEFYPTTSEILAAVTKDVRVALDHSQRWERSRRDSVLDIGAGNGKALHAFKEAGFSDLYAIEKSAILRGQLDAGIYVIGTDFAEQSLISKQVDVIFCNPPYSAFEEWTVKIIRESAAPLVYLVIPQRWADSPKIKDALTYRDGKTKVVGSYDFENAEDRTARAKVQLLRITLASEKEDAFDRAFGEQFAPLISRFRTPAKKAEDGEDTARTQDKFKSLVIGESYPEAIVGLYLAEMAHVERNYQLASELDPDLMRELEVSPAKILHCLKARLSGMRNLYWSEVFGRLAPITDRLTATSRSRILERLQKHVHVDFTVSNIHAVILWVIKNANGYIDQQLIETYAHMIDKANVVLYKSNKKPFVQDRWRYNQEDNNSHFALDYRIVMHSCGGLAQGWNRWNAGRYNNLEERAFNFLSDLLTIANNLGFNSGSGRPLALSMNGPEWTSNRPHTFYYHQEGKKPQVLFEARAFKNQNLHLRLSKKFALALNVEHGRLKGWIHSGPQAAEELKETEAANFFRSNLQLPDTNPALLLAA